MDSLIRYIQVKAFGRGMKGDHTAWFVIAAAAWMLTRVRHRDDVVYRTVLEPGERLVITTSSPDDVPPPSP